MSRRYFYHLTDGTCLVLDKKGHWTRSRSMVEPFAASAAGKLMSGMPGPVDWSDWLVSVHDQDGCLIAVVPFPSGQA
jgi:hypothetical protein